MKKYKFIVVGIAILIVGGLTLKTLYNSIKLTKENKKNITNNSDKETPVDDSDNDNNGDDTDKAYNIGTDTSNITNNKRFGLDAYNTKEVVDELLFIEETTNPLTENNDKKILVTGSTAGLGQLTAKYLLERGYSVVVHARNEQRAEDVRRDLPEVEAVVIGDLADLDQTRKLAFDINELGTFDVIIHNAGVYGAESEETLNVNSLSPYISTSLVHKPKQLIYLTSDLHLGGQLKLESMQSGNHNINYNDTKLQILSFAMAVARRWPDVQVNAVAPGWVPTRMGFYNGPYAPDSLREGYMTQVWLTEGMKEGSQVTGEFFFHREPENNYNPIIHDTDAQDALIGAYETITGIQFPN